MLFLFVTGGTRSSLGKGTVVSSIAYLIRTLTPRKVTAIKIDPYYNVDAGTLSPDEHGEVFVLEDGLECDLDLGNYERWLDTTLLSCNSITTGKINSNLILNEDKGVYLGQTIQIVPHMTDEISKQILKGAGNNDICIVELGGTVGDLELIPYFESIRRMRKDKNNTFKFIHLAPFVDKTKPIQHSVRSLRQYGIEPDILILRSTRPDIDKDKIHCVTDIDNIINCYDVDDTYKIPLMLSSQNILGYLDISYSKDCPIIYKHPNRISPKVYIIGKYSGVDAYKSIYETIKQYCYTHSLIPDITTVLEPYNIETIDKDGIMIIPGGFGNTSIDFILKYIRYARVNKMRTLGICLGLQLMVVDAIRSKHEDISHTIGSSECGDFRIKVIDILPGQNGNMTATMKLGSYNTVIIPGTKTHELYDKYITRERHRHRYEVSPKYEKMLKHSGMVISGRSELNNRVDIIEDPNLPFYIGCQFHPEFISRLDAIHPLFAKLLDI